MFGYATFGTVYGAIICLSGVFTFAQSGLQALLHHVFDDDPEPINLGLATVGLILGVALVMYVDIQGRAIQRDRAIAASAAAAASSTAADERTRLLLSSRLSRILSNTNIATPNGSIGAGGGGGATEEPEWRSLLHSRPSRSALESVRNLSTVEETGEVTLAQQEAQGLLSTSEESGKD